MDLITHKKFNGSNKIYMLNGTIKHWIEDWDSFILGQKMGLWGGEEAIKDEPENNEIQEGLSFKIVGTAIISGFKFQANPLNKMICTQKFGERPEVYRQWKMNGHNGIDFRTKFEDSPDGKRPVYAVMDGVISEANSEIKDDYGKCVRIQHSNGGVTIYAHLDSLNVANQQQIKAGDQIGISDNTHKTVDGSTGSHLHFGYRPPRMNYNNGYMGWVDPLNYFISTIEFV
jgi:murein DD-endopeptidase MepM/ murein hydrolase activator NlpD